MKAETATIILLLLILLFIVGFSLMKYAQKYLSQTLSEGFQSKQNPDVKTLDNPEDFFDSYYIDRIDMSYFPQNKNICRCSELYKEAFFGVIPRDKTKILLVGCNTGRFLDALCGISPNVSSVTTNKLLRDKAQEIAPKSSVILGDIVQNPELFMENTFTHIIFEERDYYLLPSDKRKLALEHCKKWLRPEGLLAIRVVDPDKFDPMIPTAVPLSGINIQNYLTQRKLDSQVRFTDGSKIVTHYTPIPSENRSLFREDLYDTQGKMLRSHIHRWYLPPRDAVLEEIITVGYAHKDTVSLEKCTFPGEYYEIFMNGVPKTK